jgi:hypothetical protein
MLFSGTWGKMKKPEAKNLVTLSLKIRDGSPLSHPKAIPLS